MNCVRLLLFAALAATSVTMRAADNAVPSGFRDAPEWNIGADILGGYVPGTNSFLDGNNDEGRNINSTFGGSLRVGFRFNPKSREGMLYRGLYQGVAVEVRSFDATSLLGTPVSVYAYQGMPFVYFGPRLSLGYEWHFGAAFGWKHYDKDVAPDNGAVSTSVTAHMGLGLRLSYALTDRWRLSASVGVTHYSNGNTSLPNAGVNSINASVGASYIINTLGKASVPPAELVKEADAKRWFYDIVVYGAWRRRVVDVGYDPQLCPGKFGVIGTYDENIKFYRPPFGKQLSIGLSAHAELTMPIFAVNAGIGYDFLSPDGEKRFYQSLALKAFLTKKLFLNVGYRLGNFKDPQNLMLGIGLRL